ncbi:MAG: hypothetical protein ACTSUS_07615 [Candidatus Freyarchaeota archaeon]
MKGSSLAALYSGLSHFHTCPLGKEVVGIGSLHQIYFTAQIAESTIF